jgi:diguanylate cyclase (GGDEF)-like protein
VSARLVLAVVIPTLALSVIGLRVIAARHDVVREAERVSDQVLVLDRLIDLRAALFAERVAVEILVPERRPPDAVLATTEFGRLILDGTGPLASATDVALDRLAPEDRPFEPAELDQIRADRADWSRSPDTIRARLEPLTTRTEAVMESYVTDVRRAAVDLGDRDLIAAGTTFQRSLRLPDAAGEIFGALSDLWAAAPADRPQLQSAVAAQLARFETSAESFAATLEDATGPVADFWNGPMQIPEAIRTLLDQVLAGELSSPERQPGEPPTVGLALLEAVDWTIEADELPLIASDAMIASAAEVAADARSTERLTAVLVLLAIALSVVAAVLFGRSIVAPVRRLTDHAERVGSGELTLDPLPLGGPPDVAAAAQALNDVVGTLRLLEQKSRALADFQLDHASLHEPLPGELGAALQRSTEVLSTSIVERERLRAQLLHDARHDPLTGLANRAALIAALDELRGPGGDRRRAALVFIDLDGLKQINDRLGHGVGDVVLQVTAQRVAELTPDGSTAARLGGDEFVVLLHGVEHAADAVAFARTMVDALGAPIAIDAQTLAVRASAGVALADDLAGTLPGPRDLLQRADLAVHDAKQAGPGTVICYDAEFGRRVAADNDIELALTMALQPGADELRLVYQPVVDARTGAVASLETLVRWDRRGHGRVMPDGFVPVAERTGLIVQLDMWMLRMVAVQLAAWSKVAQMADLRVSVNVSGRTLLQSSFVADVADALQHHAVRADRLTIEVTETALVTDLRLAGAQLARLRASGVHVAIDDFGTGYTSIAHLRAMPVDQLKIDSSFIQGLPDPGDRVLIQMIQDVAHLLGLSTVAEGVENREQTEILTAIGCDALQGYYFSEPIDAGAIARWVSTAAAGAFTPGTAR